MLSLTNFSKSYSGQLIVKASSFEFVPGIYWLKGENGSGKTTFFKSLAGVHPCNGHIVFSNGIALHKDPVEYRRIVTYAEAEPEYPGFLTGRDLFRFVSKARQATPEHHKAAELFGIKSYYENPCSTYSSGMLKKLSLAIAFLGASQLIILDEPLITLDEQSRKILFQLIRGRLADEKTIIIVSSHQELDEPSLPAVRRLQISNKTLELA
jgi:ABC-2 type transport system ATP-binding protein